MKTETLGTTYFVGIFKNRRVPFDATIEYNVEVKSEDGLKA
jgi:hypothetical protein